MELTQYTEYSTIPQTVRDIVANRCTLLDEYILFQTGDYEYSALIHNLVTDDTTLLVFSRYSSGNYSNYYRVTESEGSWDYSYSNEYYCYSNVGVGTALSLPVYDGLQAHSCAVITVVLLFLIVFKSSLFPFIKRK